MTIKTPRYYQREGVDALYEYWRSGSGVNPLLVLPTGSGKSFCISMLAKEVLEVDSDARIICVTHVKELIEQNYLDLMEEWPFAPAGIYSAGLNRREIWAQILFCGIQSIWKHFDTIGRCDIMIIDEAHLLSPNSKTMYRKFISGLLENNPRMKIVGLTATHYRLGSGYLHEDEEGIFDGVAYEAYISDLVAQGFLAPLVSKAPDTRLNTSNLPKRGSEYTDKGQQEAFDIDEITKAAVHEIIMFGEKRRSWIIFATGVDHAIHIRDEIRRYDVSCETITGKTPADERAKMLLDFKAENIRALVSVGVLSTGFNAPKVDLIGLLRATMSTSWYVQALGRGMRMAEGKENCLVLDFAGNIEHHGPVDNLTIRTPSDKKGDTIPVKECPECATYTLISHKVCPECGFEFITELPAEKDEELKIDSTATTAPVMGGVTPPEWVSIDHWDAYYHEKKGGGTPSLRVEYCSSLETYSEWICIEHQGFARAKAEKWWLDRGDDFVPTTIDEALERFGDLICPEEILVSKPKKFWEILAMRGSRILDNDQAESSGFYTEEIPF
ncbi:MAG: DNA helicase [Desulfocapsa sp.]|nr:MAG: DNA helicase [Desulfocapsa sp.]